MLKIVIVEQEKIAKDAIFMMRKILKEDFTFVFYEKIVDLVKDPTKDYDVIILNEAYNNVRITSALNFEKTNSIFIYLCHDGYANVNNLYGRVFSIHRENLENELMDLQDLINSRLLKHSEYLFSYNGITLRLKFHDIYYIEKEDKNLIYYTKKGEFYERGSVTKKAHEFEEYDFVRINSGILVNYEYIFKIEGDELELNNHMRLPISRSRKPKLLEFIRKKTDLSK
ncbi:MULTISPECIES: LytTR family DNA-binding domain-containing protein [unclassified Breznakia]|uniref:LytTR family DNA-binding domain-containing protein n=1 Tax=unclassified Breznakia TaxID=2623764 RepID=UPI0024062514|nr:MULTISPECIES: LytTR family DNA-binding domain-containing protein [unclassified Breznakia]MDF9837810.1 DNA-binding LytR/AlgR family response regulator [Breznakia sp. PFB2-8]MDF9859730.1 DNA-binding LytR/AlgR family response regulator [Breznakia sp. PH5-24]